LTHIDLWVKPTKPNGVWSAVENPNVTNYFSKIGWTHTSIEPMDICGLAHKAKKHCINIYAVTSAAEFAKAINCKHWILITLYPGVVDICL
jgi:hypothetical protein